jgi:hypothetical protein
MVMHDGLIQSEEGLVSGDAGGRLPMGVRFEVWTMRSAVLPLDHAN